MRHPKRWEQTYDHQKLACPKGHHEQSWIRYSYFYPLFHNIGSKVSKNPKNEAEIKRIKKQLLRQLNTKSSKSSEKLMNPETNLSSSHISKAKQKPMTLEQQIVMLAQTHRESKSTFQKPSFSVNFDSAGSATRKKRSSKVSKRGSKERTKTSFHNKKHSHVRQDSKTSFNTTHKPDDQMKMIMNLLKRTEPQRNNSSLANDKVFKAIESKIFSARGSLSKGRDSLSPTNMTAKEKNLNMYKESAFKSTIPTSELYSTVSPTSMRLSKKDRNNVSSPINMKSYRGGKKSNNRNKMSSSKKRDSGKNSSKQMDDMTIFATSGKPCFSYYNNKIMKKKRSSCKRKARHSKENHRNKTNDGHLMSASKHKPFKRMTTISTGDLLIAKKNSSFYKRTKDGSM